MSFIVPFKYHYERILKLDEKNISKPSKKPVHKNIERCMKTHIVSFSNSNNPNTSIKKRSHTN